MDRTTLRGIFRNSTAVLTVGVRRDSGGIPYITISYSMMKRIFLLIYCILLADAVFAQQWSEVSFNRAGNVRYESWNPVNISYNGVTDFATAMASYANVSGGLRDVDDGTSSRDIGILIGGLRKMEKFYLTGSIRYDNIMENDRRWNSTLWLDERNPFLIADSVASDIATEAFHLTAGAAYLISDRLRAGVDLSMAFGTLSDQLDPRPKTHASAIPIMAGIEYGLGGGWKIGVSAGVRLYHSDILYSIINAQVAYRYFLMKGMGDYYGRSSANTSGYQRDYSGTAWSGSLNAAYDGGGLENIVELRFVDGREKAKDGGSLYSFRGGDYEERSFGIYDRLLLRHDRAIHNLSLSMHFKEGDSDWYDQSREVDTEHANMVYYKILAKSRVQKALEASAMFSYRIDLLSSGFHAEFSSLVDAFSEEHYLGTSSPKSKAVNGTLRAGAGKYFKMKKCTLLAEVGAGYKIPFTQDKESGSSFTGSNDITSAYYDRKYEFEANGKADASALIDLKMPVSKWLYSGMFARCRFARCLDDGVFDSKNRASFEGGVYLNF